MNRYNNENHSIIMNKLKTSDLNTVKQLIQDGYCFLNTGLEYACYNGNLETMDFFIQQGANNFNIALKAACDGGHLDSIKKMLEKVPNRNNLRSWVDKTNHNFSVQ